MSTSRQPVDMYGKDAAQERERGKLDCILLRILRSAFLAVGVGTVGLGSFSSRALGSLWSSYPLESGAREVPCVGEGMNEQAEN